MTERPVTSTAVPLGSTAGEPPVPVPGWPGGAAVSTSACPAGCVIGAGQDELHGIVVGVEEQQEMVVADGLAAGAALGDGRTVQEHRQRPGVAAVPVRIGHFPAGRGEPHDVPQAARAGLGGAPR